MAFCDKGLWSWGHVIYDYKGYINNIKKLGLDSVIIWNDIVPLNAVEVISYAHSKDVKVIWGFAWGWVDKCGDNIKDIGEKTIEKIQRSVLKEFTDDYKDICPDGIYFQSFTELGNDSIGGRCIASVVTDFVNDIAGKIYEIVPDIEIMFGIHYTSVKNHLDEIARVDKRISIIWEDCGSFPYHYDPEYIENFDDTVKFTKTALALRGQDEKCGFIIKGMTTLDWSKFQYHTSAYKIGCAESDFIKTRQSEKNKKWETLTKGWIENLEYARKIIEVIADAQNEASVFALVEDGMFENEIKLPSALFTELLNDPDRCTEDIVSAAGKYIN